MPKTQTNKETEKQNKTLFDISRELTQFEEAVSITENISPEFEERDKKIMAMAHVIRRLNHEADFQKQEAKRLNALAKVNENKVGRIKWMILTYMKTHNIDSIPTPLGRVRRQTNADAPVVLADWAKEKPVELEERFRRVRFEPNLDEIKQALKDGEKLDFAWLGDKGEQLRIE
jgi:hypothetical protein